MQLAKNAKKAKLDETALAIEFLLISVIQGVALAALATNAAEPIGRLQFEYWLYIVSAFLLILNFWAQAIMHAISFIDWPLDLVHSFLYFLASLIEVMAFTYMTYPLGWFGFSGAFFVIAYFLYLYDLRLIKKHERIFTGSKAKETLFHHMRKRQLFEFRILLPLALLFNAAAFGAILLWPYIFLTQSFHIVLVSIQTFFAFMVLLDIIRNFRKRSELITASI